MNLDLHDGVILKAAKRYREIDPRTHPTLNAAVTGLNRGELEPSNFWEFIVAAALQDAGFVKCPKHKLRTL